MQPYFMPYIDYFKTIKSDDDQYKVLVLTRDEPYDAMHAQNAWARRYFYTLISGFSTCRGLPSAARANLPVTTEISQRVFGLPVYPALHIEMQDRIIDIILTAVGLNRHAG